MRNNYECTTRLNLRLNDYLVNKKTNGFSVNNNELLGLSLTPHRSVIPRILCKTTHYDPIFKAPFDPKKLML